ncbi:MAG: dihydroorotate dehydrogenase [Geminicoccaceae bacterium]|nr:MAG: dihydroorotate dehydrogenase [Geminicoccaceae bacterium]
MTDLAVDVGRCLLANPVMPASGTFSEALADAIDLDRLGALVAKTVMPEKRAGNALPRVAETPMGMLNSIGIPCKGPEAFVQHTIPAFKRYRPPFVASISAGTVRGFADLAAQVVAGGADVVEANISCPNLEADGHAFAVSPKATARVVQALRAATDAPLWAKLSPNAPNIAEVAMAAEAAGADAVVVANTILGMAIDVERRRTRLGAGMGGLSGPAIKPIVLRMTYQCVRAVRIPVIGCGGIATAADALEFLIAGARAVQVGTATFRHPTTMIRILDDLDAWCRERGIARITDVIGTLEPFETPQLEAAEDLAAE